MVKKAFNFKKGAWLFVLFITMALLFTGCDMVGPDALEDSPSQVEEKYFEVDMEAFEQVKVEDDMYNVLVGFTQAPGEAEKNLVRNLGGEVERTFTIVDAMEINIPEKTLSALGNSEIVRYVEPNAEVEAHDQTVPWGIDRVFGDEEYSEGGFDTWDDADGESVGVAIIDTGIDDEHEDLTVVGGVRFRSTGPFLREDDEYDDDNGHGTHVAGTVAALNNVLGVVGVAPSVELYAVKVLDASGSGTISTVVAGIEWAVDEGIPVLNMSLGGSSESETLENTCEEAYEKGHLLVASAGNSGNDEETGDNVGYPAAYESVIAVAASDENDNRASFSSTGPEVELIAPGVDVWSTVPGDDYDKYSGTSMSAPHVAGSAALVWDANEDLSNIDLREILQDTAEVLDMDDNHQGYGLVKANNAVAKALDTEVASYGVEVTAPEDAEETEPGDYTYSYEVENTGSKNDTYDLAVKSNNVNFVATVREEISVDSGKSADVDVEVEITADAEAGDSAEITLTADSQDSFDSDSMIVTLIGEPGVETREAVNITDTTADLQGELMDLGGADSVEAWFKRADNETDLNNDANTTDEKILEETGTFEDTIDGLEPETTYYFKALAKNDAGVDEGTVKEFTTEEEDDDEDIVINKFEVEARTSGPWNRADVEWEVSHKNGELDEVKSELLAETDEGEYEILYEETTSVSGESASGEHNLRTRDDADKVRLTVTATEDNETSETKEIKEF